MKLFCAMYIDVVTAFPDYFVSPLGLSIVGRARDKGLVTVTIHDLRDFSNNKHRRIDDYPYGGGPGMILKAEPFFLAMDAIEGEAGGKTPHVVFMTPDGKAFTQEDAMRLSSKEWLIFLCGHYKGVDERVRERLVDEEISVGDFVLTGGELPVLVVMDAVIRLIPGVLGDSDSAATDSFQTGLLDHPHYTRPENFRGDDVPKVLLSGHHAEIGRWKKEKALERTKERRNDLLDDK